MGIWSETLDLCAGESKRDGYVPYFLAQELISDYWGHREGTYCPPKGYFVADENPEAFEVYEATFPYKEKLRPPGQLG